MKFLKGAEENQVERNVLVGTVDAASHSTYGTQRTIEEFHPSVCRNQSASNVSLFHMGIFKLLVYIRKINVIFITYSMYIQLNFSVYTV